MSKFAGYSLMVTGALACPCHLVFTLPLVAVVFGGTALGAYLANNVGLLAAASTIYFIIGLSAGWLLLQRHATTAEYENYEGEAPMDAQS